MKVLSHEDAFEVLCLQAADDGRGPVLFGDCVPRVRKALRPFMVGEEFPDIYMEFPLAGDPFMDVTVLYSTLEPGVRIRSEAAKGMDEMLDWYARVCNDYPGVSFGFELDTKDPHTTAAAVHFQPRTNAELVEPFCEAVGEPDRARPYLDLAERMPKGWPLSFFGMFRGRPGSPLRVCGYMSQEEKAACVEDPRHLASSFDRIGFTAYDSHVLDQASQLMATAPESIDFQFDVYPDGTLGSIFAIDVQFGIDQPEAVQESFGSGPASRVMNLLQEWGIADDRLHRCIEATFARSIPVELSDGVFGRYAFTLMPQWVKARWANGILQPSKLYYLGGAGLLD